MLKALLIPLVTFMSFGLTNKAVPNRSGSDNSRFAPIGSAVKLFDHGTMGTSRYYNYCPSIFEENGVRHIYYCANRDAGNVTDYIAYRSATYNASTGWTYSDMQIVLGPTSGAWDLRHTCDPCVVKGEFQYNNVTYSYLMNYLGCSQDDSMGNGTGFAVSNNPAGPWTKCEAINPFIPFNPDLDVWGNGQVSMINLDKKGHIIYFYSYGGKDGTYEIVREYDFSNLNNIQLIRSNKLPTTGQISGDITNNDADFSYDPVNKKLVMVKSKHPYNTDGLEPSNICERLILYYLDLGEDVSPFDEVFKSAGTMKNWQYIGEVSSDITNYPRNHNPGLVTDEYGHSLSDEIIEVNFAVCVNSDSFWTQIANYRIFATSFRLNYGKFAQNRLNRGAKLSFKQSTSTTDFSTIRLNLGTDSNTKGDGLYIRVRNYKSIDTPIDLSFETNSGYKVSPTSGLPFTTYSLDGKSSVQKTFRSGDAKLVIPCMLDGYIYIPYSSLTSNEVGTRNLDSVRYIFIKVSLYYDYFASFSIGDVFNDSRTIFDVSEFSAGVFNSKVLVTTNSSYTTLKRLPATDFDPNGKDYLGGIRMTMNYSDTDYPAQWILRNENSDLSGEGLYFRMKNNTTDPHWLIFYVLATNNHRMRLNNDYPIYYYDTSANYINEIAAREFGTYFYLPSSFDGFVFIPYSSLIDEEGWSGNSGTTMRYDSVAHIYFGASSKYDSSLDVIIGDVFTTNTYLYDGSLSRYDDFNTHAQKVYYEDYVNIEYVDGYLKKLDCFAIDFLNDTYPCTTKAPEMWDTYKNKFLALSQEDRETLINTNYSNKFYNNCTDLEKCCWRYDLAVSNLGLENFMNRSISNSNIMLKHNIDNKTGIILLISSAMTILSSLAFVLLRRRKEV